MPLRVFWALYPLIVTFIVIATGNHWCLRRCTGAMTAGALRPDRALATWLARASAERVGLLGPHPASGATGLMASEPRPRAGRGTARTRPPQQVGPVDAGDLGQMRTRLIESRLTPNAISMTGLVLNLVAAALVWQRCSSSAAIAFIVGSICDTLDGRYSRMSGKGTPFGAFLDSTLDRMEEGIVLTAVGAYFAGRGDEAAVAAVVAAVLFSLMVSYTRARAEALGVECKVGIASRAVRVVILSIGLVFAQGAGPGRLPAPGARGVRARGADHRHDVPAHLPRAPRAQQSCRPPERAL